MKNFNFFKRFDFDFDFFSSGYFILCTYFRDFDDFLQLGT
jgi:hypothetical protein